MGRTIPSFGNVLDMEKEQWKPFRAALDKSEGKELLSLVMSSMTYD